MTTRIERVFNFADGKFSFHTAIFGADDNYKKVVFRFPVNKGKTIEHRAFQKGIIGYNRIVPATDAEITNWLSKHPRSPISF